MTSMGMNRFNDPTTVRVHRPAVATVLALSLGILIDKFCPVPVALWASTAVIIILLSTVAQILRKSTVASLFVLTALIQIGGLRHHMVYHLRADSNIANYASVDGRPARLLGIVVSDIEIRQSEHGPHIPSWMELDRSQCEIKCLVLQDGAEWKPVTGNIRLFLNGHLTHVQIGDHIECLGRLKIPDAPHNPGDFDYREYLRRQGIDALVTADHPRSVTLVEHSTDWQWILPRLRARVRQTAQLLFAAQLSPESHSIAASLLIGDRTRLTDSMEDSFRESGMMHILAISGLHVGILAGFVTLICRLLNCSPRTTAVVVVASILLYAGLTNHRPPVLRATLLIILMIGGAHARRRVDTLNVLAACAVILLLFNPEDLFDIGAQLSFLAVAAIVWSSRILRNRPDPQEMGQLPVSESWAWLEFVRPLGRWLYEGLIVTGAIWLVTLPLMMTTFHLIAPIGLLLNLFILPLVAVVLGIGYLFLIVGLLVPEISWPLGALFDWSLQLLLMIIKLGQAAPLGHLSLSGFSIWWLIGFYILLYFALMHTTSLRAARNVKWSLLGWAILGVLPAWPQAPTNDLRITVLSVGHGLAIVIELPTGEVLLYDAGNSGDGQRAERTVASYLWSQNIQHLDAIIVSHADHDHFSGLYGIIEKFTVSSIFISQPFLDFEQIGVVDLCESAARKNIPLHIVAAGDSLQVQASRERSEVSLQILHPAVGFNSDSDNANSIVLLIEHQSRRVLLTGDLERDGLDALLAQSPRDVDVLLSPHHGSAKSNPQALLDWSSPETVIVSTSDRKIGKQLEFDLDSRTPFLTTALSGAISITIGQAGQLHVEEFLHIHEHRNGPDP